MRIDINPRGNGACPLCNVNNQCHIQKALKQAMVPVPDRDMPIELVIYSCPHFKEKV